MYKRQSLLWPAVLLVIVFIFRDFRSQAQGLWVAKSPVGNTTAMERQSPSVFSIGGYGYVSSGRAIGWKTTYSSFTDLYRYDPVSDSWSVLNSFNGSGRYLGIGFSVNGKGYIGVGMNEASTWSYTPSQVVTYMKDLWEFNPATNTWAQKADLGVSGRMGAHCFVIGNYAYVGGGYSDNSPTYRYDHWRYNASLNTWTQVAALPSAQGRYGAAAFAVGGKGYISCGYRSGSVVADLWEYDTTGNYWVSRAPFPGGARTGAGGFAANAYGYVCGGQNAGPSQYFSDCWRYDPSTNTWLQKNSAPWSISMVQPFTNGDIAYFCGGWQNLELFSDKLLQYNATTDTWSTKSPMGHYGRSRAVAQNLNGKFFLGTGVNGDRNYNVVTSFAMFRRDNWMFNPLTDSWEAADSLSADLACAASFVIDSNIYIVGGVNMSQVAQNTLWEYNPNAHTWSQRAVFPAAIARMGGLSMSIGNRGFFGFGVSSTVSSAAWQTDWWEYLKTSNTWVQKSTPPVSLQSRYNAMCFAVSGRGYFVGGLTLNTTNCETWEYNPANDSWTRKADLSTSSRIGGAGFSIRNKGYVSCGWNQYSPSLSPPSHHADLWEYDPAYNVWAQKGNPPFTNGREGCVGAGIDGKGYLCGGMELAANPASATSLKYLYKSDFYEYTPDNIYSYPTATGFCAGDSITVNFTTEALNPVSGNVFTLQLSNATGSFGSPVTLGTLTSTATSGTIVGTIPSGQAAGTKYRVRVTSSNFPDIGDPDSLDLIISRPDPTVSSFTPTTGLPGDSITINGTNYVGAINVMFNGVNTAFTYISATQLKAVVPSLCATGKISVTNLCATGQSSANFTVPDFSIILHTAIEGLWNGIELTPRLFDLGYSSDSMATDTLVVELRQPLPSFGTMAVRKAVLKKDGSAIIAIPGGFYNGSYYLMLRCGSSLETWSKLPQLINTSLNYNFRSASTQAYDNGFELPMKQVTNGIWAFFSGDVDQDGAIDGPDMNQIDNDATGFAYGYIISDLTGDGVADGLDMNIVDNNAALFIFIAQP